MNALHDLPIATEDTSAPHGFQSSQSEDILDGCIGNLIQMLGVQNTLFLWTCLLLEEVLPTELSNLSIYMLNIFPSRFYCLDLPDRSNG
jgi:hypothetical protein